MIVDVNVTLSRWPFRHLAGDDPAGLVARLRKRDVVQAWAGSFDGILHKDMAGVNSRLARDCRNYGAGMLVPFGTVNPKLPDWQDDLRRCQEEHKMPGIRLYPNYHGYDLKDPLFRELLAAAAKRGFIVQIAARMEDERTQHPFLRVPNVDLGPLADALASEPRARVVVLNWSPGPRPGAAQKLTGAGEVYFDFSSLEGTGGLGRFIQQIPPQRVLFGSNFPLFYFESAFLKVQESGLTEEQRAAVLAQNARKLVPAGAAPARPRPAGS